MLKRILTAIVCIPILVLLLISESIWLTVGVTIITVAAMWEFYRAIGLLAKNKSLCVLGIICSCLICAAHLFNSKHFMTIAYIYVVLLFIIMLFSYRYVTITDAALIIVGNIYIAYFMMHIILVRHLTGLGHLYIWLIFIGAFSTDTFAYFTGKFLGRHKLIPEISPKKTVEGAIGGVIGCGLCFIAYGYIMQTFFHTNIDMKQIFLLGLLCAIVSEVGDLVASAIKRECDIKDFGNVLPGHGGILDRFDSILFVAPTVYLFLAHIGILV